MQGRKNFLRGTATALAFHLVFHCSAPVRKTAAGAIGANILIERTPWIDAFDRFNIGKQRTTWGAGSLGEYRNTSLRNRALNLSGLRRRAR
jgi:hypothetical protein